jgi:uncharacterized phiE125 gp8 family phage protein
MWYPASVTTAPESEPVTLLQAKQQVGVSASDTSNDAVFTRLIATERGYVEKYCGIKIVTQTLTLKCDSFCDFVRVPIGPVQSVSSVAYVDVDGVDQTLATSVYEARADGFETSIVLKFGQSWPTIQRGSRITLVLVAGFAAVPSELVSAILLRVSGKFWSIGQDPTLRLESIDGVIRKDWDQSGAMDKAAQDAVRDLLENFRCWSALGDTPAPITLPVGSNYLYP